MHMLPTTLRPRQVYKYESDAKSDSKIIATHAIIVKLHTRLFVHVLSIQKRVVCVMCALKRGAHSNRFSFRTFLSLYTFVYV